jgi:hypothetical protein
MYDYLKIYSDNHYEMKVKEEHIEQFLIKKLNFIQVSKMRFSIEINGELITATGILADSNGNYAFNSLDDLTEINLIEIDIPDRMNNDIEEEINNIANAIANEFSWLIEIRE